MCEVRKDHEINKHGRHRRKAMPEILQIVVLVYVGFLSCFHYYRYLNPIAIKIKK